MARSIEVISQSIISNIQSNVVLADKLTSTSKTAVWRLLVYVFATAAWTLESLFDLFRTEMNSEYSKKQVHNAEWYSNMAKQFQYGYALNRETGEYDVIDEAAQIVKFCACSVVGTERQMKIAKLVGDNLEPLSIYNPDELTPFTNYIKDKRDFIVDIKVINMVGDKLKLVLSVFVNPLVLNDEGQLLTNPSVYPVVDTIKAFLKAMDFDGEFIPVKLQDALQATIGVDIPTILSCQTKYAQNDWVEVDGKTTPVSGYLTIDEVNDLTINYHLNV